MRHLHTLCIAVGLLLLPHLAPSTQAEITVPNSTSPEGKYEATLEFDDPSERRDEAPAVAIREVVGGRLLVSFPFAADPSSDEQKFSTKMSVHWNADETAVAMIFRERHYSQLVILKRIGESHENFTFVTVQLPKTSDAIAAVTPRFKEFRARWHYTFQGWMQENKVMFAAGASAILHPPDPGFYAWYSFTLDIKDPITPIVTRMEYVGDDIP